MRKIIPFFVVCLLIIEQHKRTFVLRKWVSQSFLSLVLLGVAIGAQAQEPYTLTTAMISMRDGVKLNTRIYTPTRPNAQFPILLLRTPYGIGNATPAQIAEALPEIAGLLPTCSLRQQARIATG